jgi:predicted deacylase
MRMSLPSQVWSDIDFERDGKQIEHVFVPHSVNRSAYGNVAIPIVLLKNGAGPTILLTAGNHGDEFEGQIVASRLARRLEADDIRGLLIIIPGLNFPAAKHGSRVSPLDAGNLNRAFPGDPGGTVTEQIAYYVHNVLMPMADIVIDLHSGGSSLDYLPTAFTNLSGRRSIDSAAVAAMRAFGAPLCMVFKDDGDTRRAFSSAHQNDCIYLSTELGGTGSVNADNLAYSYAGTVRALAHFELLTRDAALQPIRSAERTRFVQVPDRRYQLHASSSGIFEPTFKLGDEVTAGTLAGLTYCQQRPTSEPVPSYFQADGFVICRRHPALVEAGDCIAHTAIDFDAAHL